MGFKYQTIKGTLMYWIVLALGLLLSIGLYSQYKRDNFYKPKDKSSKKLKFKTKV